MKLSKKIKVRKIPKWSPRLENSRKIIQMDEILQELRALRGEIGEMRLKLDDNGGGNKVICKGITGNGTVCRNGALAGGEYCRMHGREPKVKVVKKKAKEPKMKKIQPEHTHDIGEKSDGCCKLCNTHGDVLNPDLPNDKFVYADDDIENRLRQILQEEEMI